MTDWIDEATIQAAILVAVSNVPGAMFWRNNTGTLPTAHGTRISFGLPGSSDIIGIFCGRFVGIEVKTRTCRQSAQQKRFQAAVERAGGLYVLARSVDDALAAIRGAA
jgi:hypothetical protein